MSRLPGKVWQNMEQGRRYGEWAEIYTYWDKLAMVLVLGWFYYCIVVGADILRQSKIKCFFLITWLTFRGLVGRHQISHFKVSHL